MQRQLKELQAAGVPLAMGSDSGNWPVFPYEFHGPTSVRELEVLQEGGISAKAVLAISTLNGATLLGMESEIGTVEVGKRADLVVLHDDPSLDVSAYRTAVFVVRDNEIRSPQDWMQPLQD